MAYFRKERRTWTATWRQGGKKYTKGGFTSRRIAEMFENKKHIEKERRLVDLPVTDETTIEIVINRFLAHQKARKRPKAYRLDEMMSLNFLAYCNGIGHLYARHLDKEVLNQYIREKEITPNRRGKKIATRTINNYIATIRLCFSWAKENEIIEENPFEKVKLYPIEREDFPRILTHEEVALIEKISRKSYIYSAIFVLLRTGLRSGELCSLDVSDIDLWNRKIIIRAKKAKGKRTRYVPIVDEVFVIIDNLMKEARENDREFLFANTAGKRQDGINLLRRFQMVLKQAQKEGMDISRVNIHTLRRTFISHMVMAGEDAIKIMAIVGHEDYQTMKKYLAFCGSYLASIPNLYNKEK